jgi:hypothetical protein
MRITLHTLNLIQNTKLGGEGRERVEEAGPYSPKKVGASSQTRHQISKSTPFSRTKRYCFYAEYPFYLLVHWNFHIVHTYDFCN